MIMISHGSLTEIQHIRDAAFFFDGVFRGRLKVIGFLDIKQKREITAPGIILMNRKNSDCPREEHSVCCLFDNDVPQEAPILYVVGLRYFRKRKDEKNIYTCI